MIGSRKSRWLKLFTLLAAMLMLAAACGDDPTETAPEEPASSPTEAEEAPEFTTLEEGVLQVGSCLDYRPFEFVKDGDEMGFDVELTEEIAPRLGLEVEWVRANFDTIFTTWPPDQFDMVAAAASTITDERLEVVDFSDAYFNARQGFSINTEVTPDITSTDQLEEGDVVAVQKGTTGKLWAEENLAPNGVEIKCFTVVSGAFTDLEAGTLSVWLSMTRGRPSPRSPNVRVSTSSRRSTPTSTTGSPSRKDNPELTAAVNGALAEIIADGTYEDHLP